MGTYILIRNVGSKCLDGYLRLWGTCIRWVLILPRIHAVDQFSLNILVDTIPYSHVITLSAIYHRILQLVIIPQAITVDTQSLALPTSAAAASSKATCRSIALLHHSLCKH